MTEPVRCERCRGPLDADWVTRRLSFGGDTAARMHPHCRNLLEKIEQHQRLAERALKSSEEHRRPQESWLETARHHQAEADRLRKREAELRDYEHPVSEDESP